MVLLAFEGQPKAGGGTLGALGLSLGNHTGIHLLDLARLALRCPAQVLGGRADGVQRHEV